MDNNQSNSNHKPSHQPDGSPPPRGSGERGFGGAGGGFMVVFGMVLITASFIVPPTGYIDPTVLTAFGEMLTFAGSLIGIDYHYKYKRTLPNPPVKGGREYRDKRS